MGAGGLVACDNMTRFGAIASLIPRDTTCVADVGYDHGKVIVHLARVCERLRLIGVEQQADAEARFWRRYGWDESLRARVVLLQGDGLHPLATREVEVVVIAGLGEKTIVDMLATSRAILSRVRRLVLAPVGTRGLGLLRRHLRATDWAVVEERLIRSKDRFYQIYAAEPGAREIDERTWLFGTGLFTMHHPLLWEFLNDLKRRYEPMLKHYGDSRHRVPSYYRHIITAIAVAEGGTDRARELVSDLRTHGHREE